MVTPDSMGGVRRSSYPRRRRRRCCSLRIWSSSVRLTSVGSGSDRLPSVICHRGRHGKGSFSFLSSVLPVFLCDVRLCVAHNVFGLLGRTRSLLPFGRCHGLFLLRIWCSFLLHFCFSCFGVSSSCSFLFSSLSRLCLRMFVVSCSYIPLLDVVASRCSLAFHSYIREVMDNGVVLGGVELKIDVPGNDSLSMRMCSEAIP